MSKQTILIADDELHLTHIVGLKLRQAGFEVLIANNGEEGLELAAQSKPDLVITDYQMPRVDGFEMCVQLYESPATAQTPVIMLTARGHKLAPGQLQQTNIQRLMEKPFSARELVGTVKELLGMLPADSTE